MKYEEEWGWWYSKPVRDAHGCGLWKSVRMRGVLFLQCIWFDAGLDSQIRLWHDYGIGISL